MRRPIDLFDEGSEPQVDQERKTEVDQKTEPQVNQESETQINQENGLEMNESEMLSSVDQKIQLVDSEKTPSEEEREPLILNEEQVSGEASLVADEKLICNGKKSIEETTITINETIEISSNGEGSSISRTQKIGCCGFLDHTKSKDVKKFLLRIGSDCAGLVNLCFLSITYLFIICLVVFILFRFHFLKKFESKM